MVSIIQLSAASSPWLDTLTVSPWGLIFFTNLAEGGGGEGLETRKAPRPLLKISFLGDKWGYPPPPLYEVFLNSFKPFPKRFIIIQVHGFKKTGTLNTIIR